MLNLRIVIFSIPTNKNLHSTKQTNTSLEFNFPFAFFLPGFLGYQAALVQCKIERKQQHQQPITKKLYWPKSSQAWRTRWLGHWRLRGSSRSFCQKSEVRGNDFSPTKVPIRYSAVSTGRALLQRGVEGTVPIESVKRQSLRRVNSDQKPFPEISERWVGSNNGIAEEMDSEWIRGMDLSVQTEIVAGIVKSESKGLDFMEREREDAREERRERDWGLTSHRFGLGRRCVINSYRLTKLPLPCFQIP